MTIIDGRRFADIPTADQVIEHLNSMAETHDILYATKIALAEAHLVRRLEAAEKELRKFA